MGNIQNELVSVIIPTYNREELIELTLDSVKNQSYRPIEIIVIDDGSVDSTYDKVDLWRTENSDSSLKVLYHKQENSGAPAARNKGISLSRGRFLQFLDADDVIMNKKLEKQIDLIKSEQSCLCLCDYYLVDENMKIKKTVRNYISDVDTIKHFIGVHTAVPLIDRKRVKEEFLEWNTDLPKLQDIDYYVRLFMKTESYSYINEPLFKYVIHEGERISDLVPPRLFTKIKWSILRDFIENYKVIALRKWPAIFYLLVKLSWKSFNIGVLPKFFRFKFMTAPKRVLDNYGNE